MRLLVLILLSGILFMHCSCNTDKTTDVSDKPAYEEEFIYREGNKLMLNGKIYKSASFNSFQLSGCGNAYELFTEEEIDRLFASLPDNLMIRTWAFPGSDDRVKMLVRLAEKNKIKLILTLGDGRSHCGHRDGAKGGDGSGKKSEWYTTGYLSEYLPHVQRLTKMYKDSPAIGMWEILNEAGDAEWQDIKVFFERIAEEIKKNDPNHLVSSGSWAPWAYGGAENFQAMHESEYIDVGSLHEYDYDYNESNTIESSHFAGSVKAMNKLNKVLIVGETGIESGEQCRTKPEIRVRAMKQKFDIYLEKGASVVLVWNLANGTEGCSLTFPVEDPLLDLIKSYEVNNQAY